MTWDPKTPIEIGPGTRDPHGFTTVNFTPELLPEADAAKDPFVEKALWLLAVFMHEDARIRLGGPAWVDLGLDGRKEFKAWTRRYVERLVEDDAGLPRRRSG